MPSEATNHTNKGRRRTCVPDPRSSSTPRQLADGGAWGERGRNDLVRIDGGRTQTKPNETWGDWGEGSENLPRLASGPRRRKNKTIFFILFFCVRVRTCSPDRWERKGREAPTSRRVKGQASTGPTRRWQRETARRARGFRGSQVSSRWRDPWLTDRWADLLGPHGKGVHRARAWAGAFGWYQPSRSRTRSLEDTRFESLLKKNRLRPNFVAFSFICGKYYLIMN